MARRSRSRDLAGLAALGALGFMAGKGLYKRPGEELAPVEDRFIPGVTPTVRGDMSPADLYADAASGARPEIRENVFDAPMGVRENVFDPRAARPATPRVDPTAAAYGDSSRRRDVVPTAAPTAAPRMTLKEQLTQPTLGKPVTRAEGAPSIYDEPEDWAAYRQQQAAARANQPPTPQGSARNIVQQMREKDKAVLAAVRRRQEEEAAAAQAEREAQAERLRETRRVQPLGANPAAMRFQDMQGRMGLKKGGAVKAKLKKMASGGMSSASKRGDGIASKGKTKCKMY